MTAADVGGVKAPRDSEELTMQTVRTIGFDIARSVQVHGVDAVGQVVIRRQLKRRHVLAFFESSIGPYAAQDEFLLAATVQNLRKLAKLIPLPAPMLT
jgi:hypothetical protein